MSETGIPQPALARPVLGAAFESVNEEQWRALALKALRGAPFEDLISKSYDGLELQPLYTRATTGQAALARSGASVAALTRIDLPDAAQANAQIRADLEGGAAGVQLVFADGAGAHGFGLPADISMASLLDGIDPAGCAFVLDGAQINHAKSLAEFAAASGLDCASAQICFGLDPLSAQATATNDSNAMAEAARKLAAQGFAGPFLVADGRIVHSAGGSEAQELAYAAAAGLACLRALEKAGVSLDEARGMIEWRMAVDADQFLSIAKLRALRQIWARIENACGLEAAPVRLHAETAWRMMTRQDPHVNLLRGTVAAFSAIAGGADSLSVIPYSQALGLPDDFARRLARNTLAILAEESHTGHVSDPAAGSGAFEALTGSLCQKAWALFQQIEAAGGMASEAGRAMLGEAVREVRYLRLRNAATRRDPITGVSRFANLSEHPAAVLAPLPDTPAIDPESFTPFAPMRVAEPFECARARALQAGEKARVFLACIGTHADYGARVDFARDLFAAGGIATIDSGGFTRSDEAAQAFRASGASLACLCSSDGLYGEHAEAFARALKQDGARLIWLAGRGGALETDLRNAGVDGFVFAGCDVLSVIGQTLDKALDATVN